MTDLVVPLALINAELPLEARFLYILLLSKCEGRTRQWCGSQVSLARDLKLDRLTLRKYIRALEQAGWLHLEHAGPGGTTFTLRNPILEQREALLQRVQARVAGASLKGETLMREWLDLLVASTEYDNNARLGSIRNPATDACLEFDRYYFKERVAIEFNGPQHYGPTDAFPDPRAAGETMARDYIKKALCQEHGIHLIILTARDLNFKAIREKVGGLLPLREVPRDDPVLRYLTQVSERYIRAAQPRPPDDQEPPTHRNPPGGQKPPTYRKPPGGQKPPTYCTPCGQESPRHQRPTRGSPPREQESPTQPEQAAHKPDRTVARPGTAISTRPTPT